MRTWLPLVGLLVAAGAFWLLFARPAEDVVLYCGVDQDQSRPIADRYAQERGLRLRYEGETEAERSVGLPQRIRQEARSPRGDVWWANEIMNMVSLAGEGLIAPLPAGVADAFPPSWRDPGGRWVAFGARARILMVNTALLPDRADWPDSVEDLLDERYAAKGLVTCMARPLTGTTFTHAVALLVRDEASARSFLERVAAAADAGTLRLAPGNGSAMRLASDPANKVAFCLTDTDDAHAARLQGAPVEVVYPDQGEGGAGTVLIPNTVGVLAGAPHPEEAARLLAWLVTKEIELSLAAGPSAQIPLRTDVTPAEVPVHVKRPGADFRAMEIDWNAVGADPGHWLEDVLKLLFLDPSR
jgi:iron(III) transport system substrate-binding protein